MCGIFGLIDKTNKKVGQTLLNGAIDSLRHRGPDFQDSYQYDNVGLAHCRLNVIDPTPIANQPFEKHNCILVFNGAILNYKAIQKELQSFGYQFESHSDTEVILSAYDYWGEDCVEHFRGMWAFGIVDKKRNTLFLSRDQASIKPLYYFDNEQYFGFSSEIKPFFDTQLLTPKMNPLIVYEFLEYGLHDHREETFYEGIYRLKGGINIVFDLAEKSMTKTKFGYRNELTTQMDSTNEVEKFKALFKESIELTSDVIMPFGASLSGGLDSSSIVCELNEGALLDDSFSSFSACFEGYAKDEQRYIDEVTEDTSTLNTKVFPIEAEFVLSLKKLIQIQEEPFGGAAVFSQFKVAEAMHLQQFKVVLDGQGGDEILAGYDVFYPYFLKELTKTPFTGIKEAAFIAKEYKNSFLDAFSRWKSRKKKTNTTKAKWFLAEIDISNLYNLPKLNSVSDLSISLLSDMGLPCLLRYADKNMMHFGVESRFPFLDQKLVDFCLQLPSKFKIRNGVRKFILREAMTGILPENIKNRRDKLGYATPQEEWINNNKDYFDGLYAQGLDLPFIDENTFEKEMTTQKKWRLMMVALWIEQFGVIHNA